MRIALVSIIAFACILIIQVSFVVSLPWPLNTMPILLAVTVYLVQYRGQYQVAWWLVGYGLWVDLFAIHFTPADSIAYAVAMLALLALLRKFFTNRSLYGILACGLTVLFIKDVASFAITTCVQLFDARVPSVEWSVFAWEAVFAVVLLGVCFTFAKRIDVLIRSQA